VHNWSKLDSTNNMFKKKKQKTKIIEVAAAKKENAININ
jgi:hypothetical protein